MESILYTPSWGTHASQSIKCETPKVYSEGGSSYVFAFDDLNAVKNTKAIGPVH